MTQTKAFVTTFDTGAPRNPDQQTDVCHHQVRSVLEWWAWAQSKHYALPVYTR